jgi:hypothetical protein
MKRIILKAMRGFKYSQMSLDILRAKTSQKFEKIWYLNWELKEIIKYLEFYKTHPDEMSY